MYPAPRPRRRSETRSNPLSTLLPIFLLAYTLFADHIRYNTGISLIPPYENLYRGVSLSILEMRHGVQPYFPQDILSTLTEFTPRGGTIDEILEFSSQPEIAEQLDTNIRIGRESASEPYDKFLAFMEYEDGLIPVGIVSFAGESRGINEGDMKTIVAIPIGSLAETSSNDPKIPKIAKELLIGSEFYSLAAGRDFTTGIVANFDVDAEGKISLSGSPDTIISQYRQVNVQGAAAARAVLTRLDPESHNGNLFTMIGDLIPDFRVPEVKINTPKPPIEVLSGNPPPAPEVPIPETSPTDINANYEATKQRILQPFRHPSEIDQSKLLASFTDVYRGPKGYEGEVELMSLMLNGLKLQPNSNLLELAGLDKAWKVTSGTRYDTAYGERQFFRDAYETCYIATVITQLGINAGIIREFSPHTVRVNFSHYPWLRAKEGAPSYPYTQRDGVLFYNPPYDRAAFFWDDNGILNDIGFNSGADGIVLRVYMDPETLEVTYTLERL